MLAQRPGQLATAGLAVAAAQAQVEERANVQLQVLPVLERTRDDKNRPVCSWSWRLVKAGAGAAPGAAAEAAKAAKAEDAARAGAGKRPSEPLPRGPSPAAMAAAAAAAAKMAATEEALLLGGSRKMW
ncbi:hypothetical protein GPECTOR_37g199 [Gonium pectorale]|uniref:Uncharacterized protein n=1 Tax=Gonium pectorale TaxID=33097 RepID=A0A150GBP9_GONPE|nr:hypothetical protein GPECTOR_37g199 [Gonium pectorale]|eukprot:KXZ47193.1 hypothetical protein GPECTOR_37g199 [Gonium pectorale]